MGFAITNNVNKDMIEFLFRTFPEKYRRPIIEFVKKQKDKQDIVELLEKI